MHPLRRLIDRIGHAESLEPPADALANWVRPAFEPDAVKDTLSGVWLGHRLHPMLTDAVIGTWVSAGLLDLLGDDGDAAAARRLVGAGVAAALPTALAGLSDYSDLYDHGRRVAFVHAMAADVAAVLQVASLVARRVGRTRQGRLLSLAALSTIAAAGYLGGHLSQVLGVGVDHTAFEEGPKEWTDAGIAADQVVPTPTAVEVGGRRVLLARVDGQVVALSNACSHAGHPLDGGDVDDGCITCPFHGSVFRLADGAVVRGPAASPQPQYHVRERDGRIEVLGHR
ncbi:MAG TPA: Rieske (2Fe-2S) protein [Euzebyales bacterium]